MNMYEKLKSGGRKANMTMLVMFVVIAAYLLQYPFILFFMYQEFKGNCIDAYYVNMLPRMSSTEFIAAMGGFLTLFGVTNASTYFSKNKDTGDPVPTPEPS